MARPLRGWISSMKQVLANMTSLTPPVEATSRAVQRELGETRAQAKKRWASEDRPRRVAVIAGQLEKLGVSMRRTETALKSIQEEQYPDGDPGCCWSCAMGHNPSWQRLAAKADHQDAEFRRLTRKLEEMTGKSE